MRAFGSFLITCVVCLGASCVFAQAADGPPLQFDPYNKHHDRHLGHNHVYPDRGAVFRDAPKGSTIVNYAGLAYRFYNGVWFEPRGPAYIVVMPPIGVVVPSLPFFATTLHSGGETYLYANETYYLPRPDLGGYEVVNNPEESAQPAKTAASVVPGGVVAAGALPAGTTAVVTPNATAKSTHLASAGPIGHPDVSGAPGVASAQATPRVPGTPQTLTIPSTPEDNADAEIKTYSYAPDAVTPQPASKATLGSGSSTSSSGAGAATALVVPAVAGATLAATQAGGSAAAGAASAAGAAPSIAGGTATAAAPQAPAVGNNSAVTEIRGTRTEPATNAWTSTAQPTAGGSAVGGAAATPLANGGSAGIAPAAAGAAAVGVAPAVASTSAIAPAAAGGTGSEGPVHSDANSPAVATQPLPRANTSTVTSTDAATPRPSSAYTYTSPPSASDYPTSGTLRTTNSTVQPVASSSSAGGVRFSATPRNGQSPDQQARDQYDCYRFGVAQTGFDPMSGTVPAAGKPGQADFDRARAACFEGRGYSIN